jgi:ArsR family transcriptional regulator
MQLPRRGLADNRVSGYMQDMRSLAQLFKALSDETRLQMLGLLLQAGELCVCDFVEVLEITQSKASRHLRYLVNAGLLLDRREAVWVYFRLAETPEPAQAVLLAQLPSLLAGALDPKLAPRLAAWRKNKARGGPSCSIPTPRPPFQVANQRGR